MNTIVLFSLIIFCFGVQLWLVLVAVSAAIPQANVLGGVVLPEWQYFVQPDRDALLFHFFVAFALIAQAAGLWLLRRKLEQPSFIKAMRPFLAAELLWTLLMINASFKVIVYAKSPWLAREAFMVLAVGAALSKIFWTELKTLGPRVYRSIIGASYGWRAEALVALGLFALIWVPDTQAVLARMFFGDHFHHFDSFLAPAWAFYKGGILNVDVMTEYGIGTPVAMAWFAKLIGGFSYTRMLWFWMGGTIIYFILCFVFLRRWLGSFGLALAGILLAVKFQLFHYTMAPFIFTFPSSTVVRYFWDIVFFLFLLAHLRTLRPHYLYAAAFCCGLQIFWVTVCGYCLTLGLVAYGTAFLVTGHLRDLVIREKTDFIKFCLPLTVIPLTTVSLLWLTQGGHLWSHTFWANMREFDNYFLSGFGLMPMYESIQKKEALIGFMGFIIPIVYMATLLVTASMVYAGKAKRDDVMIVIVAFYGLAMYHYYMGRSGMDGYYTVAIPYVFVLTFWAQRALLFLKARQRRPAILGLLVVLAYCLATNHLYVSYPNILCLSRNPIVDPAMVEPLTDGRSYFNASISRITEDQKLPTNSLGEKDEGIKHENDFKDDDALKAYYAQESDFSRDAALIARLVAPGEPAAVLSSFEMKMLIQADRRQFFYYSPILIARPMRMRTFPNSTMFTSGHAQRTLRQLEEAKPEYIFMERVFLQAPGHEFKDASLAAVLNYIFGNYTLDAQGQYLVAFKRKA